MDNYYSLQSTFTLFFVSLHKNENKGKWKWLDLFHERSRFFLERTEITPRTFPHRCRSMTEICVVSQTGWFFRGKIRTEKQPDQTQISVRHYLGKLRDPFSGGMTTERRLFTKQNNFLYNCNGHFCHLRRHILAGRSLHLIDVHLNDSGVYQCDAVNEHGMIISSTWINVAGNQERRSMCK